MSQKHQQLFIIIDEDGTELTSPIETDSSSSNKQSSSTSGSSDNDEFEEIFVDSRQHQNAFPISSQEEYINIDTDEMYSVDDEESSSNSSNGGDDNNDLPNEMATSSAMTTTTKPKSSFGRSVQRHHHKSGSNRRRTRAQGDDDHKGDKSGEKSGDSNLFVSIAAEFPLSPSSTSKKQPEKMIDEMLRLYNNFALANMSAACFRDPSVSKKLLEPYRSCLDNFDEGLAAGYVAALTGNVERMLENSICDYVPFSRNVSETLENFDDLMKAISSIPMSEFDSVLLHYSIAKFYQCVGDVFSARFASGDFNKNNRERLCIYAAACYVISIKYFDEAKFEKSPKTHGSICLAICEMKIAIGYSLCYHGIENELIETLRNAKLGQLLASALWVDHESKSIEKTFLSLNKVDYFDFFIIPIFDFQNDFVNNLDPIWQLHSADEFLDHLLFILGYGRVTDYLFLGKMLFNIKLEKRKDNDLGSIIDLFDVFLTLITFAMDYCRVPNYKFGYDHLFRSYLSLPQAEINFISPKIVDHSIIVSVARHGKLPVYATLFWKAIQILGRDSSLQSRKALIEKNFKSELAFREILQNAVNEVNVKNNIHNFYIVSERFHLMLIWYIYNGFSDFEMNYVHQRIINHVKYLETAIAKDKIIFDENEIDNFEMKGGILAQLFPKKSLYWLVYPMSKNCEYLASESVQETIAHFYVYKFGRNSKEGQKYWNLMPEAYKATFFSTPTSSAAAVIEEERESDLPEMSDIPETAKIIVHSKNIQNLPSKTQQPPISQKHTIQEERQVPTIIKNIPKAKPEKPENNQENQQPPQIFKNYQREQIIEMSEKMEKMYEKFQKPPGKQKRNNWVEFIKACPNDSATNIFIPTISEDLRKQYFELSQKMQARIAYLKEKMRKPPPQIPEGIINATLLEREAILENFNQSLENSVNAACRLLETQKEKRGLAASNSPNNNNGSQSFRTTAPQIQNQQTKTQMEQQGSQPQPSSNATDMHQQQQPPNPSMNIAQAQALQSPQAMAFYQQYNEVVRLTNNFAGLSPLQQTLICSQLAFSTGLITLEQKQTLEANVMQQHQQQQMMMQQGGLVPPPMQPGMQPPQRPPMMMGQPRPFINPFQSNAPPRGFLTAAIAQQYQNASRPAGTIQQYMTQRGGYPTASNASSTGFSQPQNIQSTTKIDESLVPTTPQKGGQSSAPEMKTPQNDNESVNEAFRLAFEHWRGVSADTPEEIRKKVVAPSLTPQSIAQYKPTVNLKPDSALDNDEIIFPPRRDEEEEDARTLQQAYDDAWDAMSSSTSDEEGEEDSSEDIDEEDDEEEEDTTTDDVLAEEGGDDENDNEESNETTEENEEDESHNDNVAENVEEEVEDEENVDDTNDDEAESSDS